MSSTADRRRHAIPEALDHGSEAVKRIDAALADALAGPPHTWHAGELGELVAEADAEMEAYAEARRRLRGGHGDPQTKRRRMRYARARQDWADIAPTLRQICDGATLPLMDKAIADRRLLPLAQVVALLEGLLTGDDQSAAAHEAGCFHFISSGVTRFLDLCEAGWRILAAQNRAVGARFLEIGAGAGLKLHMAARYFETAHGIEYDQLYIDRAVPGLEGRRALWHADALSFEGYADYDVIYSFIPVRTDRQLELEERMVATLAPGTPLLLPGRGGFKIPRATEIAAECFVINPDGPTDPTPDELLDRAMRVGRTVPSPDHMWSPAVTRGGFLRTRSALRGVGWI